MQENIWAADAEEWSEGAVAIINSGAIRASIDEKMFRGVVTAGQFLKALPFGNVFDKVKLRGDVIKEVMEHSVSNYNMESPSGRFLQVSGMRVKYDLQQPVGSRVLDIQVRCNRCKDPMVPMYEPIWPGRAYWITTIRFLADGGDGYTMLRDKQLDRFNTGNRVTVDVANYIHRVSPVTQGMEGRITFLDRSANCNDNQQIANAQTRDFPDGKSVSVQMPATKERNWPGGRPNFIRTRERRPGQEWSSRPNFKRTRERRPGQEWSGRPNFKRTWERRSGQEWRGGRD